MVFIQKFSHYLYKLFIIWMEQQLLQNIIDITPATMDDLLTKIQGVLASNSIEDETVLSNIIKSLFYGLWNFDKMINQHNLSTRISQLLLKIPKKNAILFFKQFLSYLDQKWNLIDHHRINKFMQLVRYLLASAFKLSEKLKNSKKRIDQILLQKIFNKNQQHGLAQHITDIYFEICQQVLPQGATLGELEMFQHLLLTHQNQSFRLYIGEHIFEKYKKKIFDKYNPQTQLEKIEQQIVQFCDHFLQLAKKQQKDSNRKTLYNLIGYAKSTQLSFPLYINEKRQKALAEQQKKKKKLSKFKKEQIKAEKLKRKQQKKGKKIHKIMSVRKFEDKNRMKKGIQQL